MFLSKGFLLRAEILLWPFIFVCSAWCGPDEQRKGQELEPPQARSPPCKNPLAVEGYGVLLFFSVYVHKPCTSMQGYIPRTGVLSGTTFKGKEVLTCKL